MMRWLLWESKRGVRFILPEPSPVKGRTFAARLSTRFSACSRITSSAGQKSYASISSAGDPADVVVLQLLGHALARWRRGRASGAPSGPGIAWVTSMKTLPHVAPSTPSSSRHSRTRACRPSSPPAPPCRRRTPTKAPWPCGPGAGRSKICLSPKSGLPRLPSSFHRLFLHELPSVYAPFFRPASPFWHFPAVPRLFPCRGSARLQRVFRAGSAAALLAICVPAR